MKPSLALPLRPLLAADIERVRIGLERSEMDALDRALPNVRRAHLVKSNRDRRRELLGNALLLTESMAKSTYAFARTALANLGVDDVVELYQEGGATANAYAVLPGKPIAIKLTGDFGGMLADDELVALFGHEIGHCLAHATHPDFAWARAAGYGGRAELARTFLLVSEMTADRFALLASRSLSATLRLHMRTVAGKAARHFELDAAAYLKQCRAVVDEALGKKETMLGVTHPEHSLRAFATWLFWESDVHAELTGKGPGKRSASEIDATLARLIGVASEPPRTRAPVPAVLSTPKKSARATRLRRR